MAVVFGGSVSSIKALWETRIRKIKEDHDAVEEQRKRTARGGGAGRSDSTSCDIHYAAACSVLY